jgi:shikimate kinase
LTADAATLGQRLSKDPMTADHRPALTVGGQAEIEQVLQEREPLYRACADWTVSTVGRPAEAVAEAILALIAGEKGG